MTYKTAVVIPVYNEEKLIGKCIQSLLDQTEKPNEIVVVDDGSTDQTSEILKKYPVKVIRADHRGPGSARNLGVSNSKSEIIVFVDADMTFDRDFLKNLTKPIRSGISKGVYNSTEVVSNYDNIWAKCWNINQGLSTNQRLNSKSKEDTEDFRAILKSEFDRVGGFSITGYTDSRTLVPKLGYRPTQVADAISFHENPSTLSEVFTQSRWIGKRRFKFGLLGSIYNLIRYSFFSSIILGIIKSVRFGVPKFVLFKIVYDFGFSSGILSSILGLSSAK